MYVKSMCSGLCKRAGWDCHLCPVVQAEEIKLTVGDYSRAVHWLLEVTGFICACRVGFWRGWLRVIRSHPPLSAQQCAIWPDISRHWDSQTLADGYTGVWRACYCCGWAGAEGTVSVSLNPSLCVGFHKAKPLSWTKGLGLTCLTHWDGVLLAKEGNPFWMHACRRANLFWLLRTSCGAALPCPDCLSCSLLALKLFACFCIPFASASWVASIGFLSLKVKVGFWL